ncbi:hypothetical protein FQN57_004673 [Myotisia sp. PD_48]|nr:hypothetical protein FQN57_004673 [Myotisia sp. PD_48]
MANSSLVDQRIPSVVLRHYQYPCSSSFPPIFRLRRVAAKRTFVVTRSNTIKTAANMTKKFPRAQNLQLAKSKSVESNQNSSSHSPPTLSPITPRSPMQNPASPLSQGSTIRPVTSASAVSTDISSSLTLSTDGFEPPPTPGVTAIPPYPPSPRNPPTKHGRDPSKSFFANFKASRSTPRIPLADASGGSFPNEKPPRSRGSSKDSHRHNPTQEETDPAAEIDNHNTKSGHETEEQQPLHSRRAISSQGNDTGYPRPLASKKSKPRFAGLLTRTKSIRVDGPISSPRTATAQRSPTTGLLRLDEFTKEETLPPLKTAPLQPERSFREAMGSTVRNRSADRPQTRDTAQNRYFGDKQAPSININHHHPTPTQASQLHSKNRAYGGSMISSSFNQVTSSTLFSNLKHTSTGAADRIGKAGKGFFGKITRSASTQERELVTDDNYVCSVINLPLVEQTRRTRMVKTLQNSKDKTEFWMPALPWRCIEYVTSQFGLNSTLGVLNAFFCHSYLNFRGCEEEGLYRVPGSGKEVKHWQRRFDTELDINLFDEPELYDINTIGSMFKAWLRQLPDEIFPKSTQAMIAQKCAGATTAPQLLKDELSKLPPYNYYLLFTITCHLSLLHSYVDKNKMDYRNLCICFQPCMKIDGFCFQFLVCDWKNCWQGCWTEKQHLELELEADRKVKEKETDQDAANAKTTGSTIGDERAVSSSGSSQTPPHDHNSSGTGTRSSSRSASLKKPQKEPLNPVTPGKSGHSRSTSQLPELGPPLSPIRLSSELATGTL